jgi:hypothetical protein
VTAVQFITEERLMSDPTLALDPVALVGFEGLWGLLYFTVLAPVLSLTPASDMAVSTVWHEDFVDSFVQLSNKPGLCWLVLGYFVTILVYNVSANFVTQVCIIAHRVCWEECLLFLFSTLALQLLCDRFAFALILLFSRSALALNLHCSRSNPH